MRILHTSDWHLGHTLRDWDRADEHAAFLAWLLDTLEAEQVDALLIAGDIFDTANPSAAAQEAWYEFLVAARRRCSGLDIVVIGGNHDSAARLDAPNPLLRAVGVSLVGGLTRGTDGTVDPARAVVPIRARNGDVGFVAAVPFLRPPDLPLLDSAVGDVLIEGVRAVYRDILHRVRARASDAKHAPLIAMGHLYMATGEVSELSERRILGGNQHALPVDIFPGDIGYVALGHLHRAQRIGGLDRVRYSGSPIPLSMAEAGYAHQVAIVDMKGEGLEDVRAVLVPRRVPMMRIPATGSALLVDVVRAIRELPALEATALAYQPFLEISVRVEKPEPSLQQQIQDALKDRGVRLVRLSRVLSGNASPLADVARGRTLDELSPEQVFVERHRREHSAPPSAELVTAFGELLAHVHSVST